MTPNVALIDPGGLRRTLIAGDVIGRFHACACPIADPRVAMAHASISVRAGRLQLHALVEPLGVFGRRVTTIELTAGLDVELAPGCTVTTIDVVHPARSPVIEGPGLARRIIGGVQSLTLAPRPRVQPGFTEGADAVLWGDLDALRFRLANGVEGTLRSGDSLAVGGRRFRIGDAPPAGATQASTEDVARPLRLVLSFETVTVSERGHLSLLGGSSARLVSELFDLGGRASWQDLASRVCEPERSPAGLRASFDKILGRLRRQLSADGIIRELVRPTRTGELVLLLGAADAVEDRL